MKKIMNTALKSVFVAVSVMLLSLASFDDASAQWFDDKLPELPPPVQYGNIVIKRNSENSDMAPVIFPHWLHRSKYTCKVCHGELEFEMKVNTTEITMDKINKGQYCGACHDGTRAFNYTECKKCHTTDLDPASEKFKKLYGTLPKAGYGNRIDWVEAVRKKLIKPKKTIREGDHTPAGFKKTLILQSEWNNVPPAIFPHDIHNYWLDCSNCHPDLFNIKMKTTKHFLMQYINEGKFCGACHLNVAFPLNDCKRCHPDMTSR